MHIIVGVLIGLTTIGSSRRVFDNIFPEAYVRKQDSSDMLQSMLLALNPAAATRSTSAATKIGRNQVNKLEDLALFFGADAPQMGTLNRPVARAQRASSPLLQFEFPKLPDFGGGDEKKPEPPPQDEEEKKKKEVQDARSPERKRFEEEETGYLFFQGATPLTGQQDDLAGFLSREDLSTSNDGDVLKTKILLGGAVLGLLVLLVFLITA